MSDHSGEPPYEVDYGGQRWYRISPIQHGTPTEWWECPVCGSELSYNPTHDVSMDGLGLSAVPDVWRCLDCGYNHAE